MQPSLGIMYALCFVAIAIAFAYAAYLIKWVRQQDPGNPQIVKVAGLIQSGANAFMRKEYTILAGFAGVAAVLALTMWRTGALTFVTDHGSDLQALLPTVQVTLPEKQPPKILPEKLGRPVTSRPGENIYTRVSSVLESLLNAAENIKS